MLNFLLIFLAAIGVVASENDEWVWKSGRERSERAERPRYQIYERPDDFDDFDDNGPVGFRPQNVGPYGPNSRPIVPSYQQGNKGVLVGPGGPTGIVNRPNQYYEPDRDYFGSNIIPSEIRNDPRYREYDTCKCRYSFNCPATGLKFGNCAKDKRYCCYNSRKFPGLQSGHLGEGPHSFYPGSYRPHVPAGFAPTSNYYGNRRPHGNYYGHGNPSYGNYQLYRDDDYDDYERPQNGPLGFDIYSRSSSKNQTAEESPESNKQN